MFSAGLCQLDLYAYILSPPIARGIGSRAPIELIMIINPHGFN